MIKKITKKESIEIIRKWDNNHDDITIKGKFYTKDGYLFIGIDNQNCDCWVEEFDCLDDCIKWLN